MSKIVILLFLCLSLFSQENIHKSEHYSFANWKNLILLNKTPFKSDEHNAYVDIYVNKLAKDTYINKKSNFKEGSLIIKPLYPEENRENIARLVIMMKMKKGYDEDFNDWWYGVYDKTGLEMWYEGKIMSCIACHIAVEESDYLFTHSVMKKIIALE